MPSPSAKSAARDQRPSRPQSGAKNAYLLTYNALSAALWASILYRVLTLGAHEVSNARKAGLLFGGGGKSVMGDVYKGLASGKVYNEMEGWVRGVQSLAACEVLHSLFGNYALALRLRWKMGIRGEG
jgi:very-long-chain (3R)-3-hydroxyacyl-CoA dehydratase